MADVDNIPEAVRRLARLVEENGLSELRYEEGDLKITLRTAAFSRLAVSVAPVAAFPSAASVPGASPETAVAEIATAATDTEDARLLVQIDAPMMGVFYRAPAQDSPPFIEIGDRVEIGQTIGLIEAMKVFSEVPAEAAGRVREIPARSGALVQPGDPLIILEKDEE